MGRAGLLGGTVEFFGNLYNNLMCTKEGSKFVCLSVLKGLANR